MHFRFDNILWKTGIFLLMKPRKAKKETNKSEQTGGGVDEFVGNEALREGTFTTVISKIHYTPQGDHPEDRIYRDREYIRRLREHMDEVYDSLEKDLGVKEGDNWLFDFVHNEDRNIEFEEYLAERGVDYAEIVESKGEPKKKRR